jgi:hypothetical protein
MHVAKLPLNVSSMSNALRSLVILSSYSLATLWATRCLHWRTTMCHREWMTVDATIPMSSSSELIRHGRNHSSHLVIRNRAIEYLVLQHLAGWFDLMRHRACLACVAVAKSLSKIEVDECLVFQTRHRLLLSFNRDASNIGRSYIPLQSCKAGPEYVTLYLLHLVARVSRLLDQLFAAKSVRTKVHLNVSVLAGDHWCFISHGNDVRDDGQVALEQQSEAQLRFSRLQKALIEAEWRNGGTITGFPPADGLNHVSDTLEGLLGHLDLCQEANNKPANTEDTSISHVSSRLSNRHDLRISLAD